MTRPSLTGKVLVAGEAAFAEIAAKEPTVRSAAVSTDLLNCMVILQLFCID